VTSSWREKDLWVNNLDYVAERADFLKTGDILQGENVALVVVENV